MDNNHEPIPLNEDSVPLSDQIRTICETYHPTYKIEAIKIVRALTRLGLAHAKAIVDEEWHRLNNLSTPKKLWEAEGKHNGWL